MPSGRHAQGGHKAEEKEGASGGRELFTGSSIGTAAFLGNSGTETMKNYENECTP